MGPPFHAEHIGSFVRPQRLIEAARARKNNSLSEEQFRQVQEDATRETAAFQGSIGLPSVTDGEFRRRSWSAGFIDAVDGFGLRDGALGFRNESGVMGVAASPYAKEKLQRRRRIVADDFHFLKSVVKRGVPKVTIAAPDVMHWFLGPQAYDHSIYPDREAFLADLTRIYRDELAELAKEGCKYLQLDDTALPCNCDPNARKDVAARPFAAVRLLERRRLGQDRDAGGHAPQARPRHRRRARRMEVAPLGPVMGAAVHGVDLSAPLPAPQREAVQRAFDRHLLLVFPSQRIDEPQQIAFSRQFGELQVHVLDQYRHPRYPEIYLLSNVKSGKTTGEHPDKGTLVWHSDLSFQPRPALATILYGLEVPRAGEG